MERNVGFFEAWRAKRKQKKNEELEKFSAKPAEGGILQKYLKLRSEGLLGAAGLNSIQSLETTAASNDNGQQRFAFTEERRRSVLSPTGSRRSSVDSRRGSINSFGSVQDIQERFLALSKERNGALTKKPVKVNKLNENALEIEKTTANCLKGGTLSRCIENTRIKEVALDKKFTLETKNDKDCSIPVVETQKVKQKPENSNGVRPEATDGEGNIKVANIETSQTTLHKKLTTATRNGIKTVNNCSVSVVETQEVKQKPESTNLSKLEGTIGLKPIKTEGEGNITTKTITTVTKALDNTKDCSISIAKRQEVRQTQENTIKPIKCAGEGSVIPITAKTVSNAIDSIKDDSISVGKTQEIKQKPEEAMRVKPKATAIRVNQSSLDKKLTTVTKNGTEVLDNVKDCSISAGKLHANEVKSIKTEGEGSIISKAALSLDKMSTTMNDSKMLDTTKDGSISVGNSQEIKRKPEDTINVKPKVAAAVRVNQSTFDKNLTAVTNNGSKMLDNTKACSISVVKTLEVKQNLQDKVDVKPKAAVTITVNESTLDKKSTLDNTKDCSVSVVKTQEVKQKPENAVEFKPIKTEPKVISKMEVQKAQPLKEPANGATMNTTKVAKVKKPSAAAKSGASTVKKKTNPPETTSLEKKLIKEARNLRENMTALTNQIEKELPNSGSEGSISFRKDPEKLSRKLKAKQSPDESFPKSQKLLTGKRINAFEEVKLQEGKKEATVSPCKVEAFLRETLSPPVVAVKEPVKVMEAVVEEILTNKSEQSKHEKPSQARYSSKGEVICGKVSIKPSSAVEEMDNLSAIALVHRPPMVDAEKTSDYFSDTEKRVEKAPEKCFSPISDFSDDSYDHYVASPDCSSYSRRSLSTPRRIFPQAAKHSPYRMEQPKEDSPVVFDAGLSFDLSSNRGSLRRHFQPQPAFSDTKTSSSFLSLRIADFLKRTDHIMEEWKHLGKGGDDLQSLVQLPSASGSKRKSATNIMIKGLLNYSKGSRTPSLRSRSTARTTELSDRTISDIDELSEMTLDLSEERASGMMQAERLEAETAERVRLEQEVAQIQNEKRSLQQTSERLEMELFYARAEVNGLSESEADFEDGGGDAALYKNKCERAMRELEFTRRRLQQQHEDDLEQLVGLKKQLEKKLTDAYEEVEEQRQVAAQWKRKVQKLQSETNDLRLLLEEQSSRNNMLEKKQRKFDSEIQMLQEELRSEKSQKERLSREKEMAVAEKYSLEQNLSSVRLELELKEEKVSALTRELEELSCGGGTEQEITQLRKAKHELEMKIKDQDEELDELAGQVSMLEGNKLRLEMSLESLRKEHRREMAARDDELDEVRANAQKKIKVLEAQLESEHEERTLLVREKHELERRLADAEDRVRHHKAADEDALQRARRDLKKTKALLRDAQVMLERAKQDSPTKAALRALKNQLEDAELARASAVKAKQSIEAELIEVTGQLEEALRAKGDAENRCQAALREMNSLRTQVDENEEELAELLKKYRQTVQQLSAEQLANQETAGALAEAEAERASLRDQLAELTARLEANTTVDPMSGLAQKKLEIRIKELESRLELEQTTRGRLEVQITRLKENVERLNEECVQARTKEQAATDLTRKLQRSLRETKEQLAGLQAKEQEAVHKRKELEKRLDTAEQEASTARTDLRLAVKRIEDLQSAISGEIGSDSERSGGSDEEDSGDDSLVSHVPSTMSSGSRVSRTPELTPR